MKQSPMFEKWGFLITEWWMLLALATLLGLFVGWLLWGRMGRYRREAESLRAQLNGALADLDECQQDLDECRASVDKTAQASTTAAAVVSSPNNLGGSSRAKQAQTKSTQVATRPKTSAKHTRPKRLKSPRAGGADDLTQINGIGPKMEKLCNSLGFYHFDQIAAWTKSEVAWVDDNLEGFKGRVTRDKWVAQAKKLAKSSAKR